MASVVNPIQSAAGGQETVFSVAKNFALEPIGFRKMAVDTTLKGFRWYEIIQGNLSIPAVQCKGALQHTRHFLFWLDYPKDVKKCFTAIRDLGSSLSSGSVAKIGAKTTNAYIRTAFAVEIFADAGEILHNENFINLSAKQLQVLGFIGFAASAALFLSSVNAASKQFQLFLDAEIGSPEFKLALIKLISKVTLATIAAIGMVGFLYGEIVASWISLSISTVFLGCSIFAHFYEQLYVRRATENSSSV